MNHTYFRYFIKIIGILTALFIGYFLISLTFTYVYPFIIAIIFAFFLHPIVTWFEKIFKMPRGLSAFTTLFLLFGIICSVFIILTLEIVEGSFYLAHLLPEKLMILTDFFTSYFETHLIPIYEKLLHYFNMLSDTHKENILSYAITIFSNISSHIGQVIQSFLLQIPTIIGLIPSSITMVVFITLGCFFILADWYRLKKYAFSIIPNSFILEIRNILHHLKKAFGGFIKAQFMLIFITGLMIFTGLWILQVEHAFTIALLATCIDLLPYIGTGIIFIPWILYLFITGNYTLTIGLAVLYTILIIVRQIIEPKILSSNIGIDPLIMLIILFISLQIWSVLGLLVAPLIVICLYALYHAGVFHQLIHFIKTND
ncbi:MAG TPA: sporulation integral membrane protein YtvI [Candidatus Avamphibacillus intestinigallinarum]|nr:sporulation integral membrane protein YtvI [Candidatus Avamphibacillus intestinigallinarum]